jgi:hypothetical protein
MKIKIGLIALLITINACSSLNTSSNFVDVTKPSLSISEKNRWDLMVGKWFGSQPVKDGSTRMEIIERNSDGTYIITFKHLKTDGTSDTQSEVGQWGVVGPVYFSIFRGWVTEKGISPSDTSNPYNYDAYEIIELKEDYFRYKSYTSNNYYTLKKVEDEFEFPK